MTKLYRHSGRSEAKRNEVGDPAGLASRLRPGTPGVRSG